MGTLCSYGEISDELTRDKFIFGLKDEHMGTELLKTHVKPDNSKKTMQDVVTEARAMESAKQTNKLILDSSKAFEEEVHWIGLRHSQMKLHREPGTCHWCGDQRGHHPWKICPANRNLYVLIVAVMTTWPGSVLKTASLRYMTPGPQLLAGETLGNSTALPKHKATKSTPRSSLHRRVHCRGAAICEIH